jgi:aryl-alcohol dehydrogenase-like predicted oxidoreductase
MKNEITQGRRKFIKSTISVAGLMVVRTGLIPGSTVITYTGSSSGYNAKGLPTSILGKTGVEVPRIALGLGSRFCTIKDEVYAHGLLNYALDNGLYYWDTAHTYENTEQGIISEERLGPVVKTRRKEIFLSTKLSSRDPDEAMRQLETSLKRLQTDHLDILKIHDVQSEDDVARLSEKGNLIDILLRMKDQQVTRFIGFSGHTEASALKMMAEKGIFDDMLIAMNHWQMDSNPQQRQELAIPAAKAKGMGITLMKIVRPRETIKTLKPVDLIQYALSLQGPDAIVLGTDSLEVLKSNLEILRNFQPMDEPGMNTLTLQLKPFYHHVGLPWMQPGYRDGNHTS